MMLWNSMSMENSSVQMPQTWMPTFEASVSAFSCYLTMAGQRCWGQTLPWWLNARRHALARLARNSGSRTVPG